MTEYNAGIDGVVEVRGAMANIAAVFLLDVTARSSLMLHGSPLSEIRPNGPP
jgi:hypothetical protein